MDPVVPQDRSTDSCAVLTDQSIRDEFREHGLRCTVQREAIYRELINAHTHPTADELFTLVKERVSGVSLATVYNTLEALSGCGLAERLPPATPSGPCRYDADRHPHSHVTLPDGRVCDVPPDLDEQLHRGLSADAICQIEERLGVKVAHVRLSLVCQGEKACAADRSDSGSD